MPKGKTMSVKMRQEVEQKICAAIVKALLKAGFYISVDNGDNDGRNFEIARSRSKKAILAAMFQTDDETLVVEKHGRKMGWVRLVYGNDGWDVLSGYTINLEKLIGNGTEADKISQHYAN